MTAPELVDIAVNLADRAFDGDRDAVVDRAAAAGVRRLLLTGTSVVESERAAELAARWPGRAWSTAGVHPHYAKGAGADTLGALRTLAARPVVVAIGECGLDFFRDLSPRPLQERWFGAQLALAAEVGLPVLLHEREASARFAAIVGEHREELTGGVAHCFTGGAVALRRYLDLGLYVGITGWLCDERRGAALRDAVRYAPLDRLLLETDAPYLQPRTIRPRPRTRRNEPCWLPHVLAALAAATGRGVDELAAATTRNAEALFGLGA